ELKAMAALAAAQVEDVAVLLDLGGGDDEVNLAAGVLEILDHVAVGLDVESVEELSPPLFRKVRLQVRDRTETRAVCQTSRALGPCRHYHGGRLSSCCRRQLPKERSALFPRRRPLGRSTTRPLWPQQNAILSLSIFPVKHLSVDDDRRVQGARRSGVASQHSRVPAEHGDEEAVGAVTSRREEQRGIAAVGGGRRLAADARRPRFAPR